tara:strand:+ start:732 stop:1079 length:348 start_codon:yes stop_codon:yes gene_type:complete
MKKVILYFGLILFFIGCDKNDDSETKNYHECIQTYIDYELENSQPQTPRANIEKYLYNSQEVYVLNLQNFPDGQSSVITIRCEAICSLGGIDGNANDCLDWESAEFIKNIWTDNR